MKKVLIITYYWPPSGGAGVQRWLKFSKYLPQSGWEPVILTVDPEYAAYPALDPSLEKDVTENIKVCRTKATDWFRFYKSDKTKVPSAGFATNKDDSPKGKFSRFIRGNFFIPDPRRGWNRHAFKKAFRLIKDDGIKHIITTSPPHSTQLIGLKLKKRFPEIKWIADLRDPWTDIYYYDLFYPTCISRKIDLNYERSVLNKADIITTVGPSLGKYFESKAPGTGEKIKVVQNGYDESDFENVAASVPEKFTISYTGTISDSYPVEGFVKAIKAVIDKGVDISLKFTGFFSDVHKENFISALGNDRLTFIPYSDHKTVVRQMLSSSMQFLVLAKDPGNKSFLPGKLFEYIASGKPVLCLGPADGDSAVILEKGGFGKCFEYDDAKGIADYIISSVQKNSSEIKTPPAEFSRKNLSMKIARLLE
ncbi:MAG: glycosyltransferase family 4 protein [Bacteroidia bacterium]|nr:glycosyltransferase family 4 protein [Bacteroidia bacterium]